MVAAETFFYIRHDNTKVSTIIRKIQGSRTRFVQELRAALQIPIPRDPDEDKIRLRAGSIEIKGNYVKAVRKWLIGLGF